jgi:phosphate/sulfate permease
MVNAKMLVEILSWWILSPLISALLAIGIAYLAGIR